MELVVVLLLVGILAVVAIPRFMSTSQFDSRGFYDQTLAILRYAQKTAIAQRRNVCVTFASSGVTLTVAAAAGNTATCGQNLAGPTGTTPFAITAKAGVKFTNTSGVTTTPANFYFNALGEASSGQSFRVSGLNDNLTVEQSTGYVHP